MLKVEDIYRRFGAELYDASTEGFKNEIEFYIEEAHRSGSPTLELGCGTGRILIPIAEAGFEVVGLDSSSAMLDITRKALNDKPAEMRDRVTLVEADMQSFALERQFSLIIVPFRAFQHLLKSEEQRRSLQCIREHLNADGRLVINLFDPRLDLLVAHSGNLGSALKKYREFKHPVTGNRIIIWETRSINLTEQIIDEDWIFEELNSEGVPVSRRFTNFKIHYFFRWEMQYLLELCGFEVLELYGDFKRGAFKHGREQIWVGVKK